MSDLTVIRGTSIRCSVVFRDVDSDLLDPSTVTLKIKLPSGDEIAYVYGVDAEITRESEGLYRFWIQTQASAGDYSVRWIGVDANGNEAAAEATQSVDESEFSDP